MYILFGSEVFNSYDPIKCGFRSGHHRDPVFDRLKSDWDCTMTLTWTKAIGLYCRFGIGITKLVSTSSYSYLNPIIRREIRSLRNMFWERDLLKLFCYMEQASQASGSNPITFFWCAQPFWLNVHITRKNHVRWNIFVMTARRIYHRCRFCSGSL